MIARISGFARHYFIPHHTNNYRAKTLHHPSLIIYIIFLLFIQSLYLQLRKINPDILGYATDITHEKILSLINQERQNYGFEPLIYSMELSTAAYEKAQDMFDKNYWAHISPTGTTPWEFIVRNGYQYIYAGENLAKNFDRSEEVVSAWMESPTHRANILKKEYTEIGLAVVNGVLYGEETTLVVQEFGSRARALPVADISEVKPLVVIPTGVPAVAAAQPQLTAENGENVRLPKMLSIIIAEFMMVLLAIDSLFIWKHKTVRLTSHSLAHILFFLTLLTAMSATGIGAIL